MSFWETLNATFVQNALIAGILIGLVAGYFGSFVVQRGLSFLGDGLAHAAFGGVALGLLLGFDKQPLWIAAPFTLIIAMSIMWVKDRTSLGADTAIGVLFALSVALGVVFISMRKQYTADVYSYLFGSILYISRTDVWVAVCLFALTVISFLMWRRWSYATFDRELAQADGVPVALDDYILVGLIAVAVVVAVKLVGIVLIAAFLVIPAATSRLLSRSFGMMTWLAMALAAISVVIGMGFSIPWDIPSGATIILVQSALFFIVVCLPAHRMRR